MSAATSGVDVPHIAALMQATDRSTNADVSADLPVGCAAGIAVKPFTQKYFAFQKF
jgi:hypothetical protein